MAAAAAIMQLVGGGIAASQAAEQGRQAKAAHDYNAFIADQNAQIAAEQTQMEIRQADRENYLRLGALRAGQGKAGGTAEGSALDLLADAATQGEITRQDIAYRGALVQRDFKNTAYMERKEGIRAKNEAYMQAGKELMGGGSAAGKSYAGMKR